MIGTVVRRLAYLVPVLYGVAILALQPADQFVPPAIDTPGYFLPAGFSRLLTDDCDNVAWMIRAENARRGRLGGRVDAAGKPIHIRPGINLDQFEARLAANPPFADRYFLEYPPLALAFFRLCYLVSGSDGTAAVSASLLDEHEFNFTCHRPTNEAERNLYRGIRRGLDASMITLLLVLMGTMLLIQRGIGPGGTARASPWLCCLPAILYFTPCRFDIVPAALSLVCIALTARGRWNLAAVALGLAIAFKLYPLILAPLILRFAFQSWRMAAVWCTCCALPILISNAAMLLTDGWPGVTVPFQFQFGRSMESLLVFYDRLLPMAFAEGITGSLFRNGSVLALVVALSIRKPAGVESLLRRCVLAVMLFAALQIFYSPQWWLWFAVLTIPLARTHRGLTALIVLTDLLTYATFPLIFDQMIIGAFDDDELTKLANGLTYARGLLWMGIAGVLAYRDVRSAPPLRGGEGEAG